MRGLTVAFGSRDSEVVVLDDVTFTVERGETVGLVGESGCGKTVTSMAVIGALPGNGRIAGGRVIFDGNDIGAGASERARALRGKEIALISQEPMASLNPVYRIGWQLALAVRTHHRVSRRAAEARVLELLSQVRLPEPELVARRYPHEISGGMAQRIAIARALAGEPKLLIADEPTTALDVTIQAEILDLLRELQTEQEMAILLVSHDWGVIADLCDRVVVMYAGQVVERAALQDVFDEPRHPYSKALLASDPHRAPEATELPTIPGNVPSPGAWPMACRFHPRCGYATEACRAHPIAIELLQRDRESRCIHHRRLIAP